MAANSAFNDGDNRLIWQRRLYTPEGDYSRMAANSAFNDDDHHIDKAKQEAAKAMIYDCKLRIQRRR